MTEVVDLFDLLRTVSAPGREDAHLAPHDWAEPPRDTTLCGLQVEAPATRTLNSRPCLRCAFRAVGARIYGVREGESTVLNLSRLIETRMPD